MDRILVVYLYMSSVLKMFTHFFLINKIKAHTHLCWYILSRYFKHVFIWYWCSSFGSRPNLNVACKDSRRWGSKFNTSTYMFYPHPSWKQPKPLCQFQLNLGTKHLLVKGIQVRSNEGPLLDLFFRTISPIFNLSWYKALKRDILVFFSNERPFYSHKRNNNLLWVFFSFKKTDIIILYWSLFIARICYSGEQCCP